MKVRHAQPPFDGEELGRPLRRGLPHPPHCELSRRMKIASLLLALTFCVFARAEAEPSRVWRLWDGKAPGDFTVTGPEVVTPPKAGENPPILRITNIAEPRLEIYEPAADRKNGAAVVIVPGGGFGNRFGTRGGGFGGMVSGARICGGGAAASVPDE